MRLLSRAAPRPLRRSVRRVSAAAPPPPPPVAKHAFLSPSRRATTALAQLLASILRRGDTVCLHGPVGAGKSFFCRQLLRAAVDDPLLAVPSPTYLLQQTYEGGGLLLHHFDLYRVEGGGGGGALARLQLPACFQQAVCLVEWAERLGDLTPAVRLEVHLAETGGEAEAAAEEEEEEEDGGEAAPRIISLLAFGERWAGAGEAVSRFLAAPPDEPPLGGLRLLCDAQTLS